VSQFDIWVGFPFYMDGVGGIDQPAELVTKLWDYKDAKVEIPWKDTRTASVKVPFLGGVGSSLQRLVETANGLSSHRLFMYFVWRGQVRFWGPIISNVWSEEPGWVTISARDPTVFMEHANIRRGDDALDPSKDLGYPTVDGRGMRTIRDAVNLIPGQDYPPPGIKNGVNTCPDQDASIEVKRGDEIWSTFKGLGDRLDGPDYQFTPIAFDPFDPNYCKLDIKGPGLWGTDLSTSVVFHHGFGKKNLQNMQPNQGGKLITHAVVLSQDNKYRVVRASAFAAGRYSVWIEWVNSPYNFKTHAQAITGLSAIGDNLISLYSSPTVSYKLTLPYESEYHYGEDFDIRDVIYAQSKTGYQKFVSLSTIDKITLVQKDATGEVSQELDVVEHLTVSDLANSDDV
jgi:hypothetical protein